MTLSRRLIGFFVIIGFAFIFILGLGYFLAKNNESNIAKERQEECDAKSSAYAMGTRGPPYTMGKDEKLDLRGVPSCEALERAFPETNGYATNSAEAYRSHTEKSEPASPSIFDKISSGEILNGLIASAIWTVLSWLGLVFTKRRYS